MTRVEFTKRIALLLNEMVEAGELPIIDFVKRSEQEQKRLFDANLSKCDGRIVVSQHQVGKAMDIYFVEEGKLAEPKKGIDHWHNRWIDQGGDPMIMWDKNHFE